MPNNRKLLILIYHRVLAEKDYLRPGDIQLEHFDMQMQVLSKYFNPIKLSDAIDKLYEGNLPARSVSVSFDDGYADNYTTALPILKKYNVPSTFFIATGYLNNGIMWNDVVIESIRHASKTASNLNLNDIDLSTYSLKTEVEQYKAVSDILARLKYLSFADRHNKTEKIATQVNIKLSSNLMMTNEQLKSLKDENMEIGGHTVNHPILNTLNMEESRKEIIEGKKYLENLLGEKLKTFAYPNGRPDHDYNSMHTELVKECGFIGAVSTQRGIARSNSNRFELPRYNAWDKKKWRFLLRILKEHYYK